MIHQLIFIANRNEKWKMIQLVKETLPYVMLLLINSSKSFSLFLSHFLTYTHSIVTRDQNQNIHLVDLPEIKGNHRKFRTLVTSYIGNFGFSDIIRFHAR